MPAAGRPRHIVDRLIEERAPRLAAGPWWPLVGPVLRRLLGYSRARRMADAIAPLSGADAMAHVSALLSLRLDVRGLAHLPVRGRCVVIANHPTGIADGIAVHDALSAARADLTFFANADAERVCPGFADLLIPVPWPPETRTLVAAKRTLGEARATLTGERVLVVFAAGAMARCRDGRLEDPPWEHAPVALARRHRAPIVPLHLAGPISHWFHALDRVSTELRDITLFHELLNKVRGRYRVTLGRPLDARHLPRDNTAATRRLQAFVERTLPNQPDARLAAEDDAGDATGAGACTDAPRDAGGGSFSRRRDPEC
ncbi:hypothetical protein CCR85_06385 [Rhodothalassium salexigens]|nr:hypothetical protein [Rhodothalassium salexigens]MBK5921992.1 hypothetical protein [Rhodothalassium salexigens]